MISKYQFQEAAYMLEHILVEPNILQDKRVLEILLPTEGLQSLMVQIH